MDLKIPRSKNSFEINHHLKQICARNDLVIRPADKGGGVLILNKADYLTEMNRLLSDITTYTKLANNPTVKFKKELKSLINEGFSLGILNKKEKTHLLPSAPRIPVIYYLPKVHKSTTNPPGRPIISGIDSVTARIGKYIDKFLQPLVTATPSYLRDTTQVLNFLEQCGWREGFILATADVNSLYTIIYHTHGLEAMVLSSARYFTISDSERFQYQFADFCYQSQLFGLETIIIYKNVA